MATDKKELLDELDEDLRRVKTDVDAAKEWSRVVSRVADALEHLTIPGTASLLAAMGRKPPDAVLDGHLEDCPNCTMFRDAVADSGLMMANGLPKRGS